MIAEEIKNGILCFTIIDDKSSQSSNKVALQVLSCSDHTMLCLLERFCTDIHSHCSHLSITKKT